MERSKIGYQKWAIAIYMWATSLKGTSSIKLHRELGITQKSAYFMAQRLREAWPPTSNETMGGPVEVDETVYMNTADIMPAFHSGLIGKRLMDKDLIA